MKMLKLLTTALFMLSLTAQAGSSFSSIKEEMWLKGESALSRPATYNQLGESSVVDLSKVAWQEEAESYEQLPEELEVGLAYWMAAK
ncbi:MAG: hypothetical protein CME71_10870 [Halobacteriovorax sp.]|nr:hypothetical protein [Halobacteriovorax sp.]